MGLIDGREVEVLNDRSAAIDLRRPHSPLHPCDRRPGYPQVSTRLVMAKGANLPKTRRRRSPNVGPRVLRSLSRLLQSRSQLLPLLSGPRNCLPQWLLHQHGIVHQRSQQRPSFPPPCGMLGTILPLRLQKGERVQPTEANSQRRQALWRN